MTNKLKEHVPYVGPRPFESQHKEIFFGRKREIDEIISLIISYRVLVLYSQSGAGKTSLINAGLIPALDEEGFDVLPITRVRGLIPDDIKLDEVSNPYAYNAIISWAGEESKLDELTKTSIQDFLENRPRKEDEDGLSLPRIIILDQFEELFTSYHKRWEDRKKLILQVVQALEKDLFLRVIFTIREDFLAQLVDPFSTFFPNKLRNRFRLECLIEKTGLLAIKEPLKKTNLSISDEAAETLITDLLHVRVETSEGKIETVPGEYIEPVQLQVVCESLWRDLPSDVTAITKDHLKVFGDVDQALTMFYEKSINDTINRTSVKEGDLRSWFEQALITSAGTRGTVYRGKEKTGDIKNEAIDLLVDYHIIRPERRKGGVWYELTHDRFIKPIQDSNEKWLSERQEVEQARKCLDIWVVEWVRLGKATGGLLDEVELLEAKRWVKVLDKAKIGYSDDIKSLIKASDNNIKKIKREKEAAHRRELEHAKALAKEQERRAEEQAKSAVRLRRFIVALAFLGIIAIIAALFAWNQRQIAILHSKNSIVQRNMAKQQAEIAADRAKQAEEAKADADTARQIAERERKRAEDQAYLAYSRTIEAENARRESFSRELIAAAIYNLDKDPELSLLLSLHAVSVIDTSNKNVLKQTEDALHRSIQASQIRICLDHPNKLVSDVVFSPDGTNLVTASGGIVRVWNVQSAKVVRTLYGHSETINEVTFTPDGKRLATASEDGTVIVWDAESGQKLFVLSAHIDEVNTVTFSPDGTLMATASDDGTAKMWNVTSGEDVRTLHGHAGSIHDVTFSPDGRQLATGSSDKTARIWDVATGQELFILPRQSHEISSVAFSPDGNLLAMAYYRTSNIRIWNVESHRSVRTISGHTNTVTDLTFSPDGRWIASASFDGTAKVWDVMSGDELFTLSSFSGKFGFMRAVDFSPDGRNLATAGADGTAKIWTTITGEEVLILTGHEGDVESVSFSPDGKRVISSSSDRTAKVWNIATGKEVLTLAGHTRGLEDAAFSPDGLRLATACIDGSVKIWDALSGEKLLSLTGHSEEIEAIAYSPDGKKIATASNDSTARIWSTVSGQELYTLYGHTHEVYDVAFSSDGMLLATASRDHTAKIWDAVTGQELNTLSGDMITVLCVSFSPDGTLLATGSKLKTTILWDAISGKKLRTLIGHNDSVMDIDFSPDGKSLATVSSDKTVKVWDVATGQEINTYTGHTNAVLGVAVSPDGRYLASASADNSMHIYVLNIEDLIMLARKRVTRPLNLDECQKFLHMEECPQTALGLIAEGKELALNLKLEAATETFRRALDIDSTLNLDFYAEAREWMASNFYQVGRKFAQEAETEEDFESALKAFFAAKEIDPNMNIEPEYELIKQVASGLIKKGREHARSGEVDTASDYFLRAQMINPNLNLAPYTDASRLAAYTLVAKADKHFHQGQEQEAITQLEKAIDLYPEHGTAYRILGMSYKIAGKYETAITHLNKAVEMQQNVVSYTELADCYRLKKDYENAILFVRKALNIRPDYDNGFLVLGLTHYDMGDYENALQALKQVTEKDVGSNLVALNLLGAIYYDKLFELEAAYDKFNQAMELLPIKDMKVNFVEVTLASGRFLQAYDIASEVLNEADSLHQPTIDEQIAMRYFMICALLFQNKIKDAHSTLNEFISYYNTNFKDIKGEWNYSGTKHFISAKSMDKNYKQFMLKLIEIIEKHNSEITIEQFNEYFSEYKS